jgi:hypothetical protein
MQSKILLWRKRPMPERSQRFFASLRMTGLEDAPLRGNDYVGDRERPPPIETREQLFARAVVQRIKTRIPF